MKIFPWVIAAMLLVAAGYYYVADAQKGRQLTSLQNLNRELDAARASLEEAATNRDQLASEELTRLRKENEDVLRLRNEVRQLREERQQLSAEVQKAKASAEAAQTQVQTTHAQLQTLQSQHQSLQARQGLAVQPGGAAVLAANAGEATLACINNLRQIDGAVQQWALENRKQVESAVGTQDITPYLQGNAMPRCPAGGTYILRTVGQAPTCTSPGHALPK